MGARSTGNAVAATGTWTDPDGVRRPAGEVHAWRSGTNQTVCGLSLHRSRLTRFPHVAWADVQPATGAHADQVAVVCPRCAAAMGRRRDERRWSRTHPRP
ncbi:hypothetical protein J4035_14045 [Cellulomonas sp. zg-ZUI188]|uniref:Uncharacterized protein n=1 Tax=Cellulomonas fengjieae TaxID=2819978 RepID=A0ABS3SJ38_9CELL|nr:hypothetical protein [Cellulomonas fengjieae]MBO3102872.1 hypothetical protein [Cellulomonas fengjieae]QVI67530.1 hypothetical protein KG102_08235 [Cellulomonas fengjieae]